MDKNIKIWGVRSHLAGDLVFALPVLNYLELKYPGSYKYWTIAKKCAGFAPIFFNHPLINCIRIVDEKQENFNQKDVEIVKSCDLVINITPQHKFGMPATTPESCWWNYKDVYQETFEMSGFNISEYNNMPKDLQIPRLERWFDVNTNNFGYYGYKFIGIWPFSSYGKDSKRSPSIEWWSKTIELLNKEGYSIFHFGGEKESTFYHVNGPNTNKYFCWTHLPIFEQIKMSLACETCINTNSGSGAILAAYGAKQITLLTDDAPRHFQNFLAFAPKNCYDRNINVFEKGGCNQVKTEQVLEVIKQLK